MNSSELMIPDFQCFFYYFNFFFSFDFKKIYIYKRTYRGPPRVVGSVKEYRDGITPANLHEPDSLKSDYFNIFSSRKSCELLLISI